MEVLRIAGSLRMSMFLFLAVLAFLIGMPLIDRFICGRLGLSLSGEMGSNPEKEKMTALRTAVLHTVFLVYLMMYCYLTFISRSSGDEYNIHFAPLQDLAESIRFDSSFAAFLAALLSGDIAAVRMQISVVKPSDIGQALCNVMLYIPMGYLLPYVYSWFRKNKTRVVAVCILVSAVTENLQLITRRGCYDFDDMLFNSFGGLLGVLAYQFVACSITDPGWWKRRLRDIRFHRRSADTALSRYSRRMDCGRVTMLASSEAEIRAFFADTLGFRKVGRRQSESGSSSLVLELGGLSVEFLCANHAVNLPQQTIMLSTSSLEKVRKRLTRKGIKVSRYYPDPYTKHRSMYIIGPDQIRIIFGEY